MIELVRQGDTMKLPVVLGSLTGSVVSFGPNQNILEGVVLSELSDEVRSAMQVPDKVVGVLVESVSADSPYGDRAELAEGMLILEVNGTSVSEPSEVAAQLRQGINRFYVWYQGSSGFVVLRIQ